MPLLTSCCCWESLETGSRASAVLTGVTGVINIIIDIWMLVHLHRLDGILEDLQKEIFVPDGIIPLMYIELIFSVVMVVMGFILWVGINYRYDGKKMVFSWVYIVIIFRCYEIFLMIYILVRVGIHRLSEIIYVVPESIVVAVYWVLGSILLIAALLCVTSYWEELLDHVHGKERRARYFTKLANIRSAAFGVSGTTTPMRSMYNSRMMLGASQPSIAQSYAPGMAQRHMSQASYAPSMRSYAPSERSAYTPGPIDPPRGPPKGMPPQQGGQYPPREGQYPPREGQYPPREGQYPPREGQYPPREGQYPPRDGQYPPREGQHPPREGQYPPREGQYPPREGQYPPREGQYPPREIQHQGQASQKFFPEKMEMPRPAPRQQYQAPPPKSKLPPQQKF